MTDGNRCNKKRKNAAPKQEITIMIIMITSVSISETASNVSINGNM